MGKQWATAGKLAEASRRGAQFSKYAKEIMVAAKIGDPNPANNPRLRAAVEAAKKVSMSKDTIERAIKKGAGLLDGGITYELITYEGFTPHQVPVIVECLTDNRNRTASDVRMLFRKGQLGNSGSVSWMFNRVGIVECSHEKTGLDLEGVAIEVGAQEVMSEEGEPGKTSAAFITDPSDLDSVTKSLNEQGWTVTKSELSYLPKTPLELAEPALSEVLNFLKDIDDNDDVHRIHTGLS